MSTLSNDGIRMDMFADILTRAEDLAKAWLGDSVDLDEQRVLGHLIHQLVTQVDINNARIQDLYDRMSIANNSGVPLGNVLQLIGMEFQSAAKSTVTLTCVATEACTIPAGSTVRTAAKVKFLTLADLVFVGAGSQDVSAECEVEGPIEAGIGEINVIVTAIKGWASVTNAAAATPGRYLELDSEIKDRHTVAVSTSGERDLASIYEAVTAIAGVSACLPLETPGDDNPISVIVIGGDDDDVALAIDNNRTAGIGTAGTTSVDVYSAVTKQTETIRFTRGANVPVYADFTLQIVNPSLFPINGEDLIREGVIDIFSGWTLGDDVIHSQLPAAVYAVPGVIVKSLLLGTSSPPATSTDLAMGNTQRPTIAEGDIGISYV